MLLVKIIKRDNNNAQTKYRPKLRVQWVSISLPGLILSSVPLIIAPKKLIPYKWRAMSSPAR